MIFVAGAAGTVGSDVVRGLAERGEAVRAGVHARPLEVKGVETRPIDLDRPETLPPALEGVSVLYLLSEEILHERAMVAAARQAGVERIVKHSAWRADEGAYAEGRRHREVEREIEQSGIAWTFLRPNYFMQSFVTDMAESIRVEDAFRDSVGDARISYIDTRDVARVAVRVLTEPGHEGRAYELSGPDAITNHEVAEALTRALGRRIRYVPIDDEDYIRSWIEEGVPREEAEVYADVNRYARTGATSEVTATVRELTGREPISFLQFCRDHAPAFARA